MKQNYNDKPLLRESLNMELDLICRDIEHLSLKEIINEDEKIYIIDELEKITISLHK